MLRTIWGVLFLGGSIFNGSFTMLHPEVYQDIANLSVLPIYTEFIENYVVEYPIVFTSLLVAFEFIVGLLILSKGVYVKVGLLASLLFTLSIVPAIAPYTYLNLLLAVIPVYLLRNKYPASIMKIFNRRKHDIGKSA
jgi:hypothetical protein